MALLDEIISWSAGLNGWQQEGLRRLFLKERLFESDLDELLPMIKEAHGGGPASSVRPGLLTQDDVPGAGSGATVQMLGLSNLANVNGFPTGRAVDFRPSGLTVLFGENGAGKSGYARVLKNACRARRREDVQPNAFGSAAGVPQMPSADVTVLVDGDVRRVTWKQGEVADPDFSMVSVYDSACAEDYIEEEGTPAFQPYGLGQLNRLVAAQREMQRRITAERDAIVLTPGVFVPLRGSTAVGTLTQGLGSKTDVVALRRLGTLSDDETRRSVEVGQALLDLNPEPKALILDRLAERLTEAAHGSQVAERYVSDAAIGKFRELHQAQTAANAAYETARLQLSDTDETGAPSALLPGTGNAIWKALFEAAERFSTTDAYPGHQHPHTGPGAKCVLCQSELLPSAKIRMQRFGAFVTEQASTNASAAAAALSTALTALEGANFAPLDAATMAELHTTDPELHVHASAVMAAWIARRLWVQAATKLDDWTVPIPQLADGDALHSQLLTKVDALQSHAATLRQSVDPATRTALEAEHQELEARKALSLLLPQAEKFVADSIARENLDRCVSALNPQVLSNKMTSLAKTYVTAALGEAMNHELEALGYRRKVKPELTGRTDVGTTKVTLRIRDSALGARHMLSEGEQRAMALALFLAEIQSSPHKSAVIFDDPSTSLDHHYRRKMAQRLIALAAERQVLILTHDAVFLTEMNLALRRMKQSADYKSIGWDSAPGLVTNGLTWETMDSKMRLAEIQALAEVIKASSGDYMNDEGAQRIAGGYSKLRGTIERAVREDLMNNTVQPFSNVVSVEAFGAVIGHPPEEWDALIDIYDRACEAIEGHDTPAEHQLPLPDAQQLLNDVETACGLIAKAGVRRKAFEKQRHERNAQRKQPFQTA